MGRSIETESRLVVATGWEKGGPGGWGRAVAAKGYGVSFCSDENVLKSENGDGCKNSDYTENHELYTLNR